LNAATTVSATMIFSAMAGIKIFATGGIGGVHRGAEKNFDISADLQELSRTNVAVVCAGAKAILDLKLTMEYLETMGVPVIGYRTDQLPAFYSKDSGLKVPFRLDSVADIAGLMKTKWDLGLSGGVLITNPIPEEFSMDSSYINKSIDKALIKAKELNIEGKQLTPFLLEEIKNITEGKSLDSNIELVKNNVLLACEISKQYYS
jgi:pseudouridine-5'-phosphate glycosidase